MTALALAHFGAADVEDLLHSLTGRLRPRPPGLAAFSRHILDAAEAGDAVARGLAEAHADALAGYVLAAARRVGIRI